MPTQTAELLYSNASKWIDENPKDQRLSEEIKQDFLKFNTLSEANKVKLLITLSKLLQEERLPLEIEKWLLSDFDALPNELLFEIGAHLKNESDMSKLVSTSERMYSLFQPTRLLNKFLQRIAYGEQDMAEKLFTTAYSGNVEKIQQALLHRGTFTDYSGRTFQCSAYEYAYWAKDTHMCRMLKNYMDNATKAEMLKRVTEIEHTGLSYTQQGVAHCTHHFDLMPLIQSLQFYVDNYGTWFDAEDWTAIEAAWMKVGLAQRDVPAHVAQEYCRTDRAFNPCPPFNELILPRILTFNNYIKSKTKSWFPLKPSNSGLGFDFVLIREERVHAQSWSRISFPSDSFIRIDLAAVSRLDEVRTVELSQLREHLNPATSQSMSI